MDIITNKPSIGPKIELFSDNNISVKFLFPDGYDVSDISVKLKKKIDNSSINGTDVQPVLTFVDQLLYVTFSSIKLKSLNSPFVLYIYNGDSAIIGCDCVVSNKTANYNDITVQVVIGEETIIEVNAAPSPLIWGGIEGDINNQQDLIDLFSGGLTESVADTLYYPLVGNPSNYLTSVTSQQVTNALGYTPVSLSGSYTDPSWLTLTKSKVGLGNVLNVVQEPAITIGLSNQYWNGLKQWVNFPTIPTNNNQIANGNGYITASSTDTLSNKSGNISQWTNDVSYLTTITSSLINTALGYTPYNGATNPSGFLTSASLTGYATQSFVSSGYSPIGHTHTFASLTSIPTTISGYGITNAYTKTEVDGFGFTTASNAQTFTNKSGNISQWANNSGYLTTITNSQVITAIGYTPYNSTNPNAYISSITSGNVITALGYTPINPNGTNLQYIAGDGTKITFPTIPTNNNQLTNGAAYITASSTDTLTNKSISYSQLTGTPTIPTNANYVDTSTNQTGLSGTKSWNSAHTFASDILFFTNNITSIGSTTSRAAAIYSGLFLNNGTGVFGVTGTANTIQIRQGGVNNISAGFYANTGNTYLQTQSAASSDNFAGLQLKHTISASSAIARGAYMTSALTAIANNDVLVGWDITPTFTNGVFTGVSNLGIRVNANSSFQGGMFIKTISSATTTLTITNQNRFYTYTGTVATVWTMPTLTGNTGLALTFANTGTGSIVVNSSGGANDFYNGGLAVNTITLMAGESCEIVHNGTYWIVRS